MTMTRSSNRTFHIGFDVPENDLSSVAVEPNDSGGWPVIVYEGSYGEVLVFNWETRQYELADLVEVVA